MSHRAHQVPFDALRRAMWLRAPALAAALVVFAGCGSSPPKPDAARLPQLVAEANALCRSWAHRARPTHETEVVQLQKRDHVLTEALIQAAAYLPAGKSWKEARAKRRALEAEISKLTASGKFVSGQRDFIDRFRRLQLQIYDDVKALGVTSCRKRPPPAPIGG